ncbi:MAG: hypothetical protein IKN16_08755 [Selenomonadaceae bacterium]|nr:hypothetical protein [Selenomonadaceae bacterium]MBR6888518.1 hypothetical protein [Selenomonadaceae bacterium]
MAMIINDNTHSMSALTYYTRNTDNMQKSMSHIVSGMKIGHAGEDPSNWAVSEHMRDRIRATDQANQNVQNDTSLLKAADGAISNTVEIIQALKARAINSANDTNDDDGRAALQREAELLLAQIDNNARGTTFNGKRLLDGSQASEGLTFHIGGEANFSVNIKLENMTASALGLSGLDLSTREGALNALAETKNADGTTSPSMLDKALNKALVMQASIGAMEEMLGYTGENLTDYSENMQAAESSIMSADMAKEMTTYVKWSILAQASEYIIAQQNQNAASVLDLLAPVQ